ncbi:PLP-dependent transferase [Cryphonectria parasitica EP155]|uniref:PLP-dependent transferase n=1 Tax=Cryphonectria parasitica (strain ATCC 38755 / EP155) TaxID=660469 RepID=A0A9P4Y3E6_CRYP1|nr:PLP-dependent transferase [Cryphonectria parasitica EP155]KAF3765730.1 PLP-dependent transferase [Cryphonectria parasitica EP155]
MPETEQKPQSSDDTFLRESYGRLRQTVDSRLRDDRGFPQGHGIGRDATLNHLLNDVVPGLNGQNLSGRYYGFVTGSSLPIAEVADNIVSALDQNVQVHLPGQSISTEVENAALEILIGLLRLGPPQSWPGRTITTGATASNILGLACGREAVIRRRNPTGRGVSELGLLAACREAGIQEIQVLTSMGHSSLSKAASVVGLGCSAVKELRFSEEEPWRLDMRAVEQELQREGVASIIAVSAGEVNTGRFATCGQGDMIKLRELADKFKAWIHVDGAFGLLARILPQEDPQYQHQISGVEGLELADSITGDGHKLFNVPYDAGFFFCRDATIQEQVFQNPNAAYLTSSTPSSAHQSIQSPLNIGLENSRRFRALPLYAVLLSEGRDGLQKIICRMIELGRKVAAFIESHQHYELLPTDAGLKCTWMVVLFRDRRPEYNNVLTERINRTRELYVSGTSWAGQKATRIAVSSWRVDVEKDVPIVVGVLDRLSRTPPDEVK